MKRKMIEAIFAAVLLATLVGISKIEIASASGTIYIRENGEVDPPTAPISRAGDIYTLTNNIFETVVIERDNIVVDGNGYMVQGSGSGAGFNLTNRKNVTLKNAHITQFEYGVYLSKSNSNTISYNNLTSNTQCGIFVSNSSSNTVNGNLVVSNVKAGIFLWLANNTQINGNNVSENGEDGVYIGYRSFNNTITYNAVSNNSYDGISLDWEPSTGNRIVGNNITHSGLAGIYVVFSAVSNNEFYHNNLENEMQVNSGSANALNIWDNGYPSGGNFWSDYTGQDLNGDGIGETPYIIDANNQDNYPFIHPWTSQAYDVAIADVEPSKIYIGQGYNVRFNITVTNQGSYTQTFNITAYANQTRIEKRAVSLASQSSETLTFTWNTMGVTKGFYTLNATADQMPGEIDTPDNTLVYSVVMVTIPGDLDGNKKVDGVDFGIFAPCYGSSVGQANYKAVADINESSNVDGVDFGVFAPNYGKNW